jgi:thioredoxin 1
MASDKIIILDSKSFASEVEKSTVPVLIDFWAPWCGPCKAIAPILDEIANEFAGKAKICKVDVDSNSELAAKFNIRAIPAFLLFKDGVKKDEVIGMTNKSDLVSRLQAIS